MNSKNRQLIVSGKLALPGQENGRVKGHFDSFNRSGVLALNSEIDSLDIPEGSVITGAWVKSPSLGTTGTLQLGLRAHEDLEGNFVAEDPDGLVAEVDAGGQAAFVRNAGEALIGKTVGKGGARVFLKCTEASTLLVGEIQWVVEYLHA